MSTKPTGSDASSKSTIDSSFHTPSSSPQQTARTLSDSEPPLKKRKATCRNEKKDGDTTKQSKPATPSPTPKPQDTPPSPCSPSPPRTPPQEPVSEDELFRRVEAIRYEKRTGKPFVPMVDSDESDDDTENNITMKGLIQSPEHEQALLWD